jgi:hypothetical protein
MALEIVLRSQQHKSKVRIAEMRKRKAWRPDPEIDCLLRAAAEEGKREVVGKIAQAWWDISFGRASRGYDKHLRILNRQRLGDEILVRDAYEAEQRQLRKEALLKKYLECPATITTTTTGQFNLTLKELNEEIIAEDAYEAEERERLKEEIRKELGFCPC